MDWLPKRLNLGTRPPNMEQHPLFFFTSPHIYREYVVQICLEEQMSCTIWLRFYNHTPGLGHPWNLYIYRYSWFPSLDMESAAPTPGYRYEMSYWHRRISLQIKTCKKWKSGAFEGGGGCYIGTQVLYKYFLDSFSICQEVLNLHIRPLREGMGGKFCIDRCQCDQFAPPQKSERIKYFYEAIFVFK